MSSLNKWNIGIKTIVSPFHEMLCSLHVLYQPEHHPKRLDWALETISRLPSQLMDGILEIGHLSDGWVALIDLPARTGKPMSCREGITTLTRLPDTELAYLMLNGKVPMTDLAIMAGKRSGKARMEEENSKPARLLRDIDRIRERLSGTLSAYELFFSREWDYIEPWMNAAANAFMDSAVHSPLTALRSLHPRLICGDEGITAQKATSYHFSYEKLQQIYLFPSTFIFPHLLIGWTSEDLFLPLSVDIPGMAVSDRPPDDLLRQLKAIGDESRLRILKLLWRGPHCTKQLAPVLGISEAAVSKHLKVLLEAGLVRTERKGNYMFYSARRETLDAWIVLQRQYLEQ